MGSEIPVATDCLGSLSGVLGSEIPVATVSVSFRAFGSSITPVASVSVSFREFGFSITPVATAILGFGSVRWVLHLGQRYQHIGVLNCWERCQSFGAEAVRFVTCCGADIYIYIGTILDGDRQVVFVTALCNSSIASSEAAGYLFWGCHVVVRRVLSSSCFALASTDWEQWERQTVEIIIPNQLVCILSIVYILHQNDGGKLCIFWCW